MKNITSEKDAKASSRGAGPSSPHLAADNDGAPKHFRKSSLEISIPKSPLLSSAETEQPARVEDDEHQAETDRGRR